MPLTHLAARQATLPPPRSMLHAHPVKVAGVAVLPLGRQVLTQTWSLSDYQEGDGHEERRDIVRSQKPFVNLR